MKTKLPATNTKPFGAASPEGSKMPIQAPVWEPLEEPLTPLQEITSFVASAFTLKKLPWLAVRVIPVAVAAIAATMLWPGSGSDGGDTDLALQTVNTLVPTQTELAEIEPGLNAEPAETPRLFVQTGAGEAQSGQGTQAAATTGDLADNPTNNQSDDATLTANESDSPSSASGQSNQASTTATTARQTARATAATPTTAGPTTERPTTQAPTTVATTTTTAATTTTTTEATTTTASTTTTTEAPAPPPPPPPAPSGNCSGGGEFEWIFRDDFNGSSVSGDWAQYNSAGNAGYGLRRPSANSVYDGKLVITAQMEGGNLVSGGMSSRIDQKYGKWVFKVRTDNDPSQAVSGVVLTWPQSNAHPRDGENNIYETLVQTPNRNPFFTFIHKPFGSHSDQEYKKHDADASQWQTMTMEWTPSRITIIREGTGSRDVWTVDETGADLIPDVPHHLAIQLDGWKHSIGQATRMEVDFVEIYKYCS